MSPRALVQSMLLALSAAVFVGTESDSLAYGAAVWFGLLALIRTQDRS